MARLHVDIAARWASGGTFATTGVLVAVSVSDGAGLPLQGLPEAAFHARGQDAPDRNFACMISDFHEFGDVATGAGEYSFVVQPGDEFRPPRWLQDEVFIWVSVSDSGNNGQAVCLAHYHVTTMSS